MPSSRYRHTVPLRFHQPPPPQELRKKALATIPPPAQPVPAPLQEDVLQDAGLHGKAGRVLFSSGPGLARFTLSGPVNGLPRVVQPAKAAFSPMARGRAGVVTFPRGGDPQPTPPRDARPGLKPDFPVVLLATALWTASSAGYQLLYSPLRAAVGMGPRRSLWMLQRVPR